MHTLKISILVRDPSSINGEITEPLVYTDGAGINTHQARHSHRLSIDNNATIAPQRETDLLLHSGKTGHHPDIDKTQNRSSENGSNNWDIIHRSFRGINVTSRHRTGRQMASGDTISHIKAIAYWMPYFVLPRTHKRQSHK